MKELVVIMVGMAHCTIILGRNMIQTTLEFTELEIIGIQIGRTTITIEIQTFTVDIMVQERKSKSMRSKEEIKGALIFWILYLNSNLSRLIDQL